MRTKFVSGVALTVLLASAPAVAAALPPVSQAIQQEQAAPAPPVTSPPDAPNPAAVPAPPQSGQPGVATTTSCGSPVAPPSRLPPANSPPVAWILELCFSKQGGSSTVE